MDGRHLSLRKRLGLELYRRLHREAVERHELRTLFWECTLRCNLRCGHCGSDCTASIIRKSKCSTDFKRNDFLKKTKRTHWVRFVHLNSLIESCVFLYLWNSPFDTFL